MSDDWRLFRGQEQYLHGVTLIQHTYKPSNPSNDHDHCEFCMKKFRNSADGLRCGYSTEDGYTWICPQCYEDFKKQFEWKVRKID